MCGSNGTINIQGEIFTIKKSIRFIPLADSFLLNKTGRGHGEGRLYIGSENNPAIREIFPCWPLINEDCFFLGDDFIQYLESVHSEYEKPQQEYNSKYDMPQRYSGLMQSAHKLAGARLNFRLRSQPDRNTSRAYVNAAEGEECFRFMREIGLPNMTYVSIFRLTNLSGNIFYYFQMHLDNNSQIVRQYNEAIQERKIIASMDINAYECQMLIRARIGQGQYREKVLRDCRRRCPFTRINDERLLIASHIKPWAQSSNFEKIDCKNGLVLTPTYDRLFDQGLITFDNDRRLSVSSWFLMENQQRLGIYQGMRIESLPMDEERAAYMEYHRKYIYKG